MPVLDADRVVAALRGAFARDVGREELLRTAAEKIRAAGAPYTSVYLYMLHGNELVLEAFAGRETDHTRIPVGTGVCGTAVASGLDQNVPDVTAVGNYLACNTWTRSELVVLIRRGTTILGQIDIDSDVPDPFTPRGRGRVKQVADALGGTALEHTPPWPAAWTEPLRLQAPTSPHPPLALSLRGSAQFRWPPHPDVRLRRGGSSGR